ncbi:hypothetical protein [Cellulomonas terrae]|uniref:Uncharacterized protein n=1 Tax=Cellulomonas terrae TaxID=311234 RepID=A0A511JP71_9CELL|nr:hypothetical protein [Cellulomonas terrae]GEL99786.1 hypothetical protein CTE05_33330 [Cellulomonas terrae]
MAWSVGREFTDGTIASLQALPTPLLGLVVVTQVATVAGAGAWFPWAAPGLWAGMGGPAAAAAVSPVQLLLAVPVGAIGVAATLRWWSTAELR